MAMELTKWPGRARGRAVAGGRTISSIFPSSTVCAQAPALSQVFWLGLDPLSVSGLCSVWMKGESGPEKMFLTVYDNCNLNYSPWPNPHFPTLIFSLWTVSALGNISEEDMFVCFATYSSVTASICWLPGLCYTACSPSCWQRQPTHSRTQPSTDKHSCKCKQRAGRSQYIYIIKYTT